MSALWLALAALGAFAAWRVSVTLFPWRTCPRCEGRKRIQGGGGVHRDCARCGASGRVRRTGARKEED